MNEKTTAINNTDKEENIKKLVSDALKGCYGVAIEKENLTTKGKKEGIFVKFHSDGSFEVRLNVIVVYGLKIIETIRSAQKLVLIVMNHYFPHQCRRVDVYAEKMTSFN